MKLNQSLLLVTIAAALAVPCTVFAAKGEKKSDKAPQVNFAACDKNNDGSVTKEEFLAAMKDSGKKEQALEKQFATKDKDGNGKLSKEEFTARTGKKKSA